MIGLEIHVQLATRTKMFCGCELSFGDPPNTHTCPICLAHPGALPVTNREAVRLAILAGLALGCEIAPESEFHRKNYFYPDLSKAYQISQYDEPLCIGGRFTVLCPDGELEVGITRAHLEEDAAKLVHVGADGRRAGAEGSGVDFNRGGTPLLEIVTEPDLRSAPDAGAFLRQLRQTLRALGVSDCNMEEGSLRADANVSVRPAGSTGARHQDRAEEHEQLPVPGARHRGRDRPPDRDAGGRRDGEPGDAPLRPRHGRDPLPAQQGGGARLPLLPRARPGADGARPRRGWRSCAPGCPSCRSTGAGAGCATWASPTRTPRCSPRRRSSRPTSRRSRRGPTRRRPRTGSAASCAPSCASWGEEPWESRVTPERLAELIGLLDDRTLSSTLAKEVLAEVARTGSEPRAVVEERGLGQISDEGELAALVERLLADNPDQAEQLRGGKDKLVGFFVGQAMKATGGRADPARVGELVREEAGLA